MVEHKKKLITRRFEPQVFKPICIPFKVLDKKFPNTYKLELLKNLKVHPIFHVSFLESIARDATRPN